MEKSRSIKDINGNTRTVRRIPILPYEEVLHCDACGGEMEWEPKNHYPETSAYIHKCKDCENTITISEPFPKKVWERREDLPVQ